MNVPWLRILTSFSAIPVARRVSLLVGALAAYATLLWLLDMLVYGSISAVHASIHTVMGVVLSLLLVFRTNTAYDRWWEGRKLWGCLVNDSRNLAIKIRACVHADEKQKIELGHWIIEFAVALKNHLRGRFKLSDLDGFRDTHDNPWHVPAYIARRIYDRIEHWRTTDQLGGFELLFLDRHAASLMDVCGACERIRNTPIAFSYRWFIRQSIGWYLVSLPFGLLEDLGFWTIPSTALIAYFMIGIELIAEEVEEPFGLDADDLELETYCETIRSSVTEIIELGR